MFDIVIKNCRIVDGTGSPWYRGSLGIAAGKIQAIWRTNIEVEAKKIIDAGNRVVAPGLIDVHSHADLAVLREPECLNRLRQGVTTQIIGNCGLSAAPINAKSAEILPRPYEASLGSYPTWNWSGVSEYLERVNQRAIGTNIGVLMGHATFRTTAMNGIFNRRPTSEEYREIFKLIGEGMGQGALGISTGLI